MLEHALLHSARETAHAYIHTYIVQHTPTATFELLSFTSFVGGRATLTQNHSLLTHIFLALPSPRESPSAGRSAPAAKTRVVWCLVLRLS